MTLNKEVIKLKKVLTTKDVMNILEISESTAYKLIKQAEITKEFRVIRTGKSYRISTESFLNWLDGKEQMGM